MVCWFAFLFSNVNFHLFLTYFFARKYKILQYIRLYRYSSIRVHSAVRVSTDTGMMLIIYDTTTERNGLANQTHWENSRCGINAQTIYRSISISSCTKIVCSMYVCVYIYTLSNHMYVIQYINVLLLLYKSYTADSKQYTRTGNVYSRSDCYKDLLLVDLYDTAAVMNCVGTITRW